MLTLVNFTYHEKKEEVNNDNMCVTWHHAMTDLSPLPLKASRYGGVFGSLDHGMQLLRKFQRCSSHKTCRLLSNPVQCKTINHKHDIQAATIIKEEYFGNLLEKQKEFQHQDQN